MIDLLLKEPEVFISYSSVDKRWAERACDALEQNGIRCWVAPRDIIGGTEWMASIFEAIGICKIMAIIFSAHANDSPQVRREVECAISAGLAIIPFRIENTPPKGAMAYALNSMHWVDAFAPPAERQLDALVKAAAAILGKGSSAAATGITERRPARKRRSMRSKATLAVILVAAIVGVGIIAHVEHAKVATPVPLPLPSVVDPGSADRVGDAGKTPATSTPLVTSTRPVTSTPPVTPTPPVASTAPAEIDLVRSPATSPVPLPGGLRVGSRVKATENTTGFVDRNRTPYGDIRSGTTGVLRQNDETSGLAEIELSNHDRVWVLRSLLVEQ